jgi:F0F1-type ATP synthase assembly protein I
LGAPLRLPPFLTLVIVLAVAAYVVYHIVSTGKVQPLTIILLILLGFGLVRSLFRMWRKVREESESE